MGYCDPIYNFARRIFIKCRRCITHQYAVHSDWISVEVLLKRGYQYWKILNSNCTRQKTYNAAGLCSTLRFAAKMPYQMQWNKRCKRVVNFYLTNYIEVYFSQPQLREEMKSCKLEKKRLLNYLLTGKFFVFCLINNSGVIFEWSIRAPQNIN